MSMSIVNVKPADTDTKNIFKEGNLVVSQDGEVFLVTCAAAGYDDLDKDSFWGIKLSTGISGGGYLKSLFKQFLGTITLEGKY